MTLKHYDLEAGTEGAAATTANTGAAQVTLNAGTAVFNATSSHNGTMGVTLTGPATGSDAVMRFNANAENLNMSYSVGVSINTLPTVNTMMFTLRHATGIAFRCYVAPNGHILIDGAVASTVLDTGIDMVAGAKYRVEVIAKVGTTTTNGVVTVALYDKNSSTPLAPSTQSSTFNLGTTAIVASDILAAAGRTIRFDDVRFDDGKTAGLGPVTTVQPPTTSAPPEQTVDAGHTIALAGTETDAHGNITERKWRRIDGATIALNSDTTRTATYKAPASLTDQTVTFGYTVKSSTGLSSTEATVTHTIAAATERTMIGGTEVPVYID